MRLALALLFVPALGCGPRAAASLSMEPAKELRTPNSVSVPAVVAHDAAGVVVPTPTLHFRAEPPDLVDLVGTSMTPLRNGEGALVVESGTLSARTPIAVKVVDELSFTCAPPCAARVDEALPLDVSLRGLGKPVSDGSVVVTADNDSVKVTGTTATFAAAGEQHLTAKVVSAFGAPLPRPLESSLVVHVEPRVDRLRLTCPYPVFFVEWRLGDVEPRPSPTVCSIEPDFATPLRLETFDGDKPVTANIEWSSSEPGVAVSGIGSLLGKPGGRAMVRAKVGKAEVMLPVSVLVDGCDENRGHNVPTTLKMKAIESYGFRITDVRDAEMKLMCETNTGARCIESGFHSAGGAEIGHVGNMAYQSIDLGVVSGAIRRCCCALAP